MTNIPGDVLLCQAGPLCVRQERPRLRRRQQGALFLWDDTSVAFCSSMKLSPGFLCVCCLFSPSFPKLGQSQLPRADREDPQSDLFAAAQG